MTVVSFTENVRAGVSTITCDLCGDVVTAELRHAKTHQTEEQS